ncbi:MAG: PAS domain-containing sensor histidine kinase [Burkholderiaceae bacterium]|nr:PAS domain-containing sensor histidine kinase [Burkholderiaceae bacterium]
MYLVDESGRIVDVNKAWESQSGLDASSVVGRTLGEVFDSPVASRFEAHNRLVLDAGQPRSFEEEYAGRTYLSVKMPVRDPDGRPYAVCGLSIDITERKRAEDLLRADEERFRVMADSLPLIIWVHDADGNLQFVNRTYCEFFGVTLDQAHAGGWQSLIHPDDAAYAAQFADAVQRQVPFHSQGRVRRADGQWRWIESWGRPRFSEEGRFLGFVGSSADVTERRSTEERLREAQGALEAAIRRKNEFIATLAHEIRNPLAAIRNASAALGAPAADHAKARGIIDRQIDSLVRLVEDLLEMSRLRLGKIRFVCRRVDVRDVIDDAVVACEAQFASSRQVLRVERPANPVWVRADPVRLGQIVTNLLSNAARYTQASGHIRLALQADEHDAILSVEDDGVGLTAEEIAVVFEPFRTGESGVGKHRSGLGVGLAIVRRLAELHGGSVQASSPGKGLGSRFTVRLPLMPAAAQP